MHPSRPSLRGREGRGEGATVFSVYLANKMDHSASLLPIPPFFCKLEVGRGDGGSNGSAFDKCALLQHSLLYPFLSCLANPAAKSLGAKKVQSCCTATASEATVRAVGRSPPPCVEGVPLPPSVQQDRELFAYSWGGDPKAPSVINWLDVFNNKKLL